MEEEPKKERETKIQFFIDLVFHTQKIIIKYCSTSEKKERHLEWERGTERQ